ncbi:hypothetical protein FRC02_009293, partial [Tulasnella sp. 418]
MASVLPRVRSIAHATRQIRAFHSSNSRHVITQFTMPAMSPTIMSPSKVPSKGVCVYCASSPGVSPKYRDAAI